MFNKPALPPQPLPTDTAASGQSAPAVKPGSSDDIYIMPEKFHSEPVKSASNKTLLIAAIILLAVIVLVGAYFIYDSSVRQQLAIQQAKQTVAQQSTTPVVEPVNEGAVTTTASAEEPVTTTEPVVTSTAEEATSSPEVATTSEPVAVPPAVSRDSDNDGLTDVEENVIGTDPARPDTDLDGYKDSEEILSGYNPLSNAPGKSRLYQADFIASAKSNFTENNFSFLYPRSWKVSFIPENGQAIISIDTGEIIRISSRVNDQNISAMNWYLQLHPEASVGQLKAITTPELSGFFTSDGLTAYLTDANKERIYSFEYLNSPQAEFRYPALFTMIINNFRIETSTPAAASSTAPGQ